MNPISTSLRAALTGLAVASLVACSKEAAPPPPRITEVGTTTLRTQPVHLQTELAGRTSASMTSEVRPQIAGIVKQRLFTEGSVVKAGQVLYRIDPSTYQAAYDEARAALANAEAAVPAARLKRDRYVELAKIQGVSQQDADDSLTAYNQALATVSQQKAAVATAKINLDFTEIRAPIGGRIGMSSVTAGALVTASQTDALATIRVLDPIYVDLSQSSAAMLKLRKMVSAGGLTPAGTAVGLKLEDGSDYARKGQLKFAEVSVDEATGAVTLRATFPNPDGELLSGMYVRAVIDQATDPAGLLVPQQGVTRDATGGATALVATADDTVEKRQVTTSRVIGDKWLVSGGLAAGDRLIVEGVAKVKPGDKVKVVDVTDAKAAAAAAPAAPAALPSGTKDNAGLRVLTSVKER